MRRRSLRFEVALYLGIALCGVMVLFTLLVAWYQRNELLDSAASHLIQLSDVVTRSTRFAMLQNQPAYIDIYRPDDRGHGGRAGHRQDQDIQSARDNHALD
jgi:hypothetical protein